MRQHNTWRSQGGQDLHSQSAQVWLLVAFLLPTFAVLPGAAWLDVAPLPTCCCHPCCAALTMCRVTAPRTADGCAASPAQADEHVQTAWLKALTAAHYAAWGRKASGRMGLVCGTWNWQTKHMRCARDLDTILFV